MKAFKTQGMQCVVSMALIVLEITYLLRNANPITGL